MLEAAQQKAINYMKDEIQRQIGPTIRNINRNGFFKMSLDVPKNEPEKELYKPINEYTISYQCCCNIDVKVLELDNLIGIYCPICGGTTL